MSFVRGVALVGVLVVSAVAVGCGNSSAVSAAPRWLHGKGSPVVYTYPTPEGGSLGSNELLGRESVLLFMTTYDAVSLAASRRLADIWHKRTPRFNALLIAIEPPQNAPLVAIYRDSVADGIPVVLADQETLDGRGAFGDVRAVPGVVLLDRDGRIVYRGFGAEAYRHVEDQLGDTAAP